MLTARKTAPGRVLFAAAALHVCNDAFFAVLYPLLPFIAAELALSYAEVGLVKAAFTGSAGVLQLPAGLLAERWGEYALLVWGNGWVAAGLLGMAVATSLPMLLVVAIAGGLGGNFQHPLASAMVARAFESGRRGTAIGTLNFAGDLGKMAAPALVALLAFTFGWRVTLATLGAFGLVFSLGVGLARSWVRPPEPMPTHHTDDGTRREAGSIPPAYWLLGLVGMLDSSTRAASLTFLPFVLQGRGVSPAEVGLLFGLLFAGGAVGKFFCGRLGDSFGPFPVVVLTEGATALALLGLVWGPLGWALGLTVVFGFALNGTSSVFYGAVATLVPEGKRGRGYGLYYTGVQLAAAVAPLGYGLVADTAGLGWTFGAMAALTVSIVPLAAPIRRRLYG